jgi:hypothetical protein
MRTLADLAALRNRPAPGLGDLAAHTAQVHREAGVAADQVLHQAHQRARQIIQEAEGEAGRIMRRAEHEAFDRELAARAALDDADADRVQIRAETSRELDRLAMRTAREAELVVAEARDATALVLAEAAGRRQALAAELAELEDLKRELGASVASFRRRLRQIVARGVPADVDTEIIAGDHAGTEIFGPPAGPPPRPPVRSLWERTGSDLAHATT